MKSIKMKIGMLVTLCVLIVAGAIGLNSISSSKKVVGQFSAQLMEQECTNGAQQVDALLSRIEQSAVTLSDYALDQIDSTAKFRTDADYVDRYTEELSEIAINAANNTEGAMTVYIRYNPEFTSPTSGLFASRSSAQGAFEKLVPTDFSTFDPSDTAHVGWYYIPVNNGKPTWMDPYMNENINVEMISYVIPLVKDGISIGVVGMDIDFGVIKDQVKEMKIYESGFAFLANGGGDVVYSPSDLQAEGSGWENYSTTLQNGFTLTLTAPAKEINYEANALARRIALLSFMGILFAVLISSFVIRGITKPLRELNQAAEKIAGGELDVEVSCHGRDEVGTLGLSIKKTVERLHTYIGYINETAQVLKQLSEGDLAISLKQEYSGEFVTIKEALLTISGTLNQDMGQIKASAEQIAFGSGQLAQGAQLVSAGAAEQVEVVGRLSGLTHTLSERVKANTANARAIHEVADQAGAELQLNGRKMSEMVSAMELIAENGEKIIHTTEVMDDIAMQTNILALNASIEAARAGEAGKGFSIVAEEVKELAVKSTEAAKQISGLMKHAVEVIDGGKKLAVETERSVTESVTGTQAVMGLVEKIVADSDEQASEMEEVLLNIDKISSVAQQTSSTTQESAASAEELSGQAQIMSGLVRKFNLSR